MNHQQQHSSKSMSPAMAATGFSDKLSTMMYTYYYIHMIILSVVSSPKMMAALSEIMWLKHTLFVANLITLIYCIYRLVRNKQLAITCMSRMPNWMERLMDRMPNWMHRWLNHSFMRITMISMDLMLIWMCAAFGLAAIQ